MKLKESKGPVDYRKLWKRLIDMEVERKTDLIGIAGISSNIVAKLGRGDYISMESMKKICTALGCDIGDVCVLNEPVPEGAAVRKNPGKSRKRK